MSSDTAVGAVAPAALDYLQRSGIDPWVQVDDSPVTSAPPQLRRVIRIDGIGGFRRSQPPQSDRPVAAPTEGLLIGLSAYQIPVAFAVHGTPAGIALHLATWSAAERERANAAILDHRRAVMEAVLRGAYATVDVVPVETPAEEWAFGGLALGVPTLGPLDPQDGANAIDRLARAMAGMRWSVLVLAEPVDEQVIAQQRHRLINEMRIAVAEEQAAGVSSPLGRHYTELLDIGLKALTLGQSVGAWRTAAYLLGDESSYPSLASAWRAILSGELSLPEPVRVHDSPLVLDLAARWALPDVVGSEGPSGYRHPFGCQTLLTSAQLSALIQLPRLETPGFRVRIAPAFDVVPPAASRPAIAVGSIMHRSRPTDATYAVSTKSLTRHALVGGVTGSGKTNTIFHLLDSADAASVPFLVVEPAKAEYRTLLDHPRLGPRLRVFTPGAEDVSPFRLNPFEVPTGTTVSEHLDLLRAAFGSSFGMWTPLPQVLERCLHEVYVDRGWNLRTNANHRLEGDAAAAAAFPTLSDLVSKVAEIAPQLGYEQRVTDDIRAALTTRLASLQVGAKGAMFDVAESLPMDELLGHPTILELEGIGDDDDKAFLMALVLIRLAEYRRAAGQAKGLVHVLVVEEAHRLLANVPARASEEVADPRGQAVRTFTHLLSEIRAYGQGVLIADQVPVRLAPDVLKNTNLKIAHRTVASDDRDALGSAMAMTVEQAELLTTLGVGEALVFSEGDDTPVMVQVPLVKDAIRPAPPDDAAVAAHMAEWRAASGLESSFLPRPFCAETCAGAPDACEAARQLIADEFVRRTFARTVLSTIEEPGALDRMWGDLVSTIRARRPSHIDERALLRAFAGHATEWYAGRRGAQAGWSYRATEELATDLRRVLTEKIEKPDTSASASDARLALQTSARALHRRAYPPYPSCESVCDQQPSVCLYRAAVADVVASGRYRDVWRQAYVADISSTDGRLRQTWTICKDAGYELIEYLEPDVPEALTTDIAASARRVCLCFEQQMLADDTRIGPRTVRRTFDQILREANGTNDEPVEGEEHGRPRQQRSTST